jgi:hypothetical protein
MRRKERAQREAGSYDLSHASLAEFVNRSLDRVGDFDIIDNENHFHYQEFP